MKAIGKKAVSLFLSILLVMSVFTLPPVQADTEDSGIADMLPLLRLTGILSIDSDGEFQGADKITRAEFMIYAGRMIGINEYAQQAAAYYTDVPSDHWAVASIAALVERGALTVPEDRLFRPDDAILFEEAVKVLMTLTGFSGYSNETGGYYTGFLRAAQENGLLDGTGMQLGEPLDGTNMVKLIYHALNMDMLNQVWISDQSVGYQSTEGVTILSEYHDVYPISGRVAAADGTAWTELASLAKDKMQIEGQWFFHPYNGMEYLGHEVTGFYSKTDTDDFGTILYLTKQDGEDVLEINAGDIDELSSDYILSYWSNENGREKRAKIARNVKLVYNGAPAGDGISEKLCPETGKIKLFSTGDGSGYDLAVVTDYDVFSVSFVDTENRVIYNQYKTGTVPTVNYDESANEIVKILSDTGEAISADRIGKNDVLLVAQTPGQYIEICKCSGLALGTVEEVSSGSKGTMLTIDGKDYPFHPIYEMNGMMVPEAGDSVTIHLDLEGNIVTLDFGTSESMQFAYVFDSAIQRNGLDDQVVIKALTQQNQIMLFTLADKVTVDGVSSVEAQEAINRLGGVGDALAPQLIRYGLDAEGNVKVIDTKTKTEAENENTLQVTQPMQGYIYWSSADLLGPLGRVDWGETIFFRVPTDGMIRDADPSELQVLTRAAFFQDQTYQAEMYKVNQDRENEEVVVVKMDDAAAINQDSRLMVIESVAETLSEDDEILWSLKGNYGGSTASFSVSEKTEMFDGGTGISSPDQLGPGDIIRIGQDIMGEVVKIQVWFDYSQNHGSLFPEEGSTATPPIWAPAADGNSMAPLSFTTVSNYSYNPRISFGYAEKKLGGTLILKSRQEANGSSNLEANQVHEAFNTNNSNVSGRIVVFDSATNKVYSGTIDDVLDYESVGENCSEIVYMNRWQHPMSMVVYR